MPHDTKNLSTIGDLILLILADRSTVLSATTAATMSNNNGIKTNSQRAALGMNNIANQMSIDRGISICDGIGNDNDIDIGYHADGWPSMRRCVACQVFNQNVARNVIICIVRLCVFALGVLSESERAQHL